MSEIISETRKIFVRYCRHDDEPTVETEEIRYLAADTLGFVWKKGKELPKRDYDVVFDVDLAHDFLAEYKVQEKALAMAARLGKIVTVGKELIEEGWEMEIVVVTYVNRRSVVRVDDPTNPLVVLALQAE